MTEPRDSAEIPIAMSERGRGRPPKIRSSDVYGRSENWREILEQVWDRLWPFLSKAHSEEEVTKAFQDGAAPYDQTFVPRLSALTLRVLRESTLPKRPKPLQRFLADSLAGVGVVTPPSVTRHLRPRTSEETKHSSHSSLRVLR